MPRLVSSPVMYPGQGEEFDWGWGWGAGEAPEMQTHGYESREQGIQLACPVGSRRFCCQSQADRPDSVGFCRVTALMKCLQEMGKRT